MENKTYTQEEIIEIHDEAYRVKKIKNQLGKRYWAAIFRSDHAVAAAINNFSDNCIAEPEVECDCVCCLSERFKFE